MGMEFVKGENRSVAVCDRLGRIGVILNVRSMGKGDDNLFKPMQCGARIVLATTFEERREICVGGDMAKLCSPHEIEALLMEGLLLQN